MCAPSELTPESISNSISVRDFLPFCVGEMGGKKTSGMSEAESEEKKIECVY